MGIDPDACEIQIRFNTQSDDISQGVDRRSNPPLLHSSTLVIVAERVQSSN
jgi:S-adenosylmethionine synthetase